MNRLDGRLQHYAWGSTTALPKLLGTPSTDEPCAEYWLGAHPSAPSSLAGVPLDSWLPRHPEAVGTASGREFGVRLPYLLKLLAADQPLSLQVHPSREQAEEGFAREDAQGVDRQSPQRNYRDDWPKPEAMVALEEFQGLCGFRDTALSEAYFRRLGLAELSELIDPLHSPGGAEGLEECFLGFLRLDARDRWLVDRTVELARAAVADPGLDDPGFADFCRTAVEVAEYYPGDPGVLAALLCNRVTMAPGEAIFLRAGLMHAYLRGVGVEIMANSDNVLRGGLTPKHVDIDELARIVDFAPAPAEVMPAPAADVPVWRYPTPAPEFALWRLLVDADAREVPGSGGGRIVVVVDGTLTLTGTDSLELARGQAAFLAADETVTASGRGTAFVAAPGV